MKAKARHQSAVEKQINRVFRYRSRKSKILTSTDRVPRQSHFAVSVRTIKGLKSSSSKLIATRCSGRVKRRH